MPPSATIGVDTDALQRLADSLRYDTVSVIRRVSEGVHTLNGADVNAFGVLLAQVLGAPARTAMGVTADHLDDLAHTMGDVSRTVRDTASLYEDTEESCRRSAHALVGGVA